MTFTKKTNGKKRRGGRRKNKVMTVSMYKKLENKKTEYKFNDTVLPNSEPTNTGVIFVANEIPQTTAFTVSGNQREGNVCTMTSILWRACMSNSGTGKAPNQFFRIMFFKWDEKGVPTLNDILQNASMPIDSPLNMNNSKIIRVLYDRRGTLNTFDKGHKSFQFYRRMTLKQRYDAVPPPAPSTNLIYGLYLSDQTTTTLAYKIDHYIRVRFIDG